MPEEPLYISSIGRTEFELSDYHTAGRFLNHLPKHEKF
jgi:hypothetical protein